MPLLPDWLGAPPHQIPEIAYADLGIASPPRKREVLNHVLRLLDEIDEVDNGLELCRIGSGKDPEIVFKRIFEWMDRCSSDDAQAEEALLQEEIGLFRERACVPVGDSLVSSSALYFRLPASGLAPLLFEVPRVFGAVERLLRKLGVKDEPSSDDLATSLSNFRNEITKEVPLSINEMLAAIRVAEQYTLLSCKDGSKQGLRRHRLLVPDSQGHLVAANLCVWPDQVCTAASVATSFGLKHTLYCNASLVSIA